MGKRDIKTALDEKFYNVANNEDQKTKIAHFSTLNYDKIKQNLAKIKYIVMKDSLKVSNRVGQMICDA